LNRQRANKRRSNIQKILTTFFPIIFFSSITAHAAARKAPYLIYENDNTKMTVLWQLNSTSAGLIQWGVDQSYSLGSAITNEYNTDHQHKYVISGLTPGWLYYYQVTTGGQTYTGSFNAAPPDNATHVRFFAYGDSRSFPAIHDQVAAEMIATYQTDPSYQTLTISVGDLATDGDIDAYWDSDQFNPFYTNIKGLMANTPYISAIGNHEGTGVLFMKYFPYPYVNDRYWSYDYGPVHFTVIDQYVDYLPGSAELAWIENDLASTTKPWKVIYLHRPGWSAGNHSNDTNVQDYIHPLCLQYGVDMVFAGHNHYYSRAVVDGVQYITTGGGGSPLHTPDPNYPNIVATSMNYHFCRVAIDSNILTCEAVKPDGFIVDSFSIEHPSDVPSLGQWGMIILGIILLAFGSAFIVKRRGDQYKPESVRRI